jgi:hypothetical protein
MITGSFSPIITREEQPWINDPGLLPLASTMAWVENFRNITNGYYKVTRSEGDSDQFEYLVPFPPGYTSTMKGHWTTDVIVLDPSCSWQTATKELLLGSRIVTNTLHWYVTLPDSNLGFSLPDNQLGMFLLSSNFCMCSLDFSINCEHHTADSVHAGFSFRVRSCGWFCTFCHRSS